MDNSPLNPEFMRMAAQMYATFFATLYHELLAEGFAEEAARQAALDLIRMHLEAFRPQAAATEAGLDQTLKSLAVMLTKGGSA